jgi:periplasmic protein CpxP/Spy
MIHADARKQTKTDMKMNRLGLVMAVALGLVTCGSLASAQEADGKAKKRGMPSVQERLDRMTEELKLTDEQKPKVKAVLEASDKKRQELVGDSAVPQEQRREKMQALMEEQNKKLKEILTPEQYAKWDKMRGSMRGGGGKGGKKGEPKKE